MKLCWPGVCWQTVVLAQLDRVCWGALVGDCGRSLCHPVALPASSVSLTPPLGEWLCCLCETLLQCPLLPPLLRHLVSGQLDRCSGVWLTGPGEVAPVALDVEEDWLFCLAIGAFLYCF